jgi:hypothetical protein
MAEGLQGVLINALEDGRALITVCRSCGGWSCGYRVH